MFAKTIIDSDAFLDMSLSTQALYFHLSMRADDDGFLNNPKKIQRMIGCGDDELKILIAKKFIIPFESGVCVIKHWRIHNYIRNDRYKETIYKEEKETLQLKESGAYTINNVGIPSDNQVTYQSETQVRLGKDRIGKVSKDKDNIECINLTFIDDSIDKVKITQEQYNKLVNKYGKYQLHKEILALDNYIVNGKGNKYKDHYRALNTWCNKNGKEVNNGQSSNNNTSKGQYGKSDEYKGIGFNIDDM
jgi:hypothetical protein